MAKALPLHDLHTKIGAEFATDQEWTCPTNYGNPSAEYDDAIHRSVVFDRSNRGKVRLSGKDAIQFLHNFCTNDIINLKSETGCEAFLTTAKGRLIAPLFVSRLARSGGDELLLDTSAGLSESMIQHLSKYRITEQVDFADQSNDLAQLHFCGPASKSVANRVFGESAADLLEFQHTEFSDCASETVMVRRYDLLNLPGFDITCSANKAAELWTKLVEADVRAAGTTAFEILRIEAGIPIYGREMDEDRLVTEIGRVGQAICYTKGCYLGQETIIMARDRGHVNRKLMGLKLTGVEPVLRNCPVKVGDEQLGQVTSSTYSPKLKHAIAMAYVKRGHQTPGTEVQVECRGSDQAAVVCELPFIN